MYRRAQLRNYHFFDRHAFSDLMLARDTAAKQAAKLKSLHTSFYAPQMYFYRTTGTFSTMFGKECRKHRVLIYEKRKPVDPRLVELREKFWPTTKESRAQAAALAAAAKEVEALKNRRRTRIRTWGKSFGHSFIAFFKPGPQKKQKEKAPYQSPFAKLI